jgi:hypothetical protein
MVEITNLATVSLTLVRRALDCTNLAETPEA